MGNGEIAHRSCAVVQVGIDRAHTNPTRKRGSLSGLIRRAIGLARAAPRSRVLMLRCFRHFSLNTTGSNGKGDTNPKRQRGMPQAIWGATAAPSLTLRVGMWSDHSATAHRIRRRQARAWRVERRARCGSVDGGANVEDEERLHTSVFSSATSVHKRRTVAGI